MAKSKYKNEFKILRDIEKCIKCQACVRMCSNDAHYYDPETDTIIESSDKCVGCHFCEDICPTGAITIKSQTPEIKLNEHWSSKDVYNIIKQAETGGVLLTGMGSDKKFKEYFDHIVLNASQVTNPSIDPLREPMELRTFIGRKPDNINDELPPQLVLETPIMFTAMSYGSISLNAQKSLAKAAFEFGTMWNTGEGGLHQELLPYAKNVIVQVASGRFGVDIDYLENAAAVEIKIGQGAKPGIGGHLPGEKVDQEISKTRRIPIGTDALSPAPHHDIYSIEDLKQLIFAIKEATRY
ncbi:MAG: glutamate synthase-related protein, partial [Elusimicrobiota bacterium]|nr:glutamate synthase-related protein [Endomicrobiia bacterium]MDW8166570.1 glutamate synthase-related protein [Elusimicrobiota bacterium]